MDETLFRKNELEYHHDKHVAKDVRDYLFDMNDETFYPISKEEYNRRGDELSKQPVYSSDYDSKDDVIGFFGKSENGSDTIYKLRKSTNELVIYYNNYKDARTLSLYKVNSYNQKNRYNELKRKHYIRDILPEDDFYNR